MSDRAAALDPKRTALLVMDFQQGVLQRMPGLEPPLARVQGAIAASTPWSWPGSVRAA